MNQSPIFIVGVGRSGTTLIRQMINSHSKIAIPYESHFITKYINQLLEYGNLADNANFERLLKDLCAEPILKNWDWAPSVQDMISSNPNRDLASILSHFWGLYALKHGKTMWGDKSDYLDRMYQIRQLFPNAKFVHIVRDGRDVANSVMKMPWGPTNIKQAAEWWATHVRLGCAMGRMLDSEQYMEVRYEDLVADPELKLKEICEFLEVEFEPGMLEFYRDAKQFVPQHLLYQHYNADKAANSSRVEAWRNELSALDCVIFQQIAKDVLIDLDYPIIEHRVNPLRTKLRSLQLQLGLAR